MLLKQHMQYSLAQPDGRILGEQVQNWNLKEPGVRETLGRKNFIFAGIHDAAQVIALIYYLVGTCMASGNNP